MLYFKAKISSLLPAVKAAASCSEHRSTVPILSSLHVYAKRDEVTFTGSNLEMWVSASAEIERCHEGSTTLPARVLLDILRRFDADDNLVLQMKDRTASLAIGDFTCSLLALPAEDFPSVPRIKADHEFMLATDDFRRIIDDVEFAISVEETRYYLNGILFHATTTESGAGLRAVATDGHRLAVADMKGPYGSEQLPRVIVPREPVRLARKLMLGDHLRVEVGTSDQGRLSVSFSSGDIKMTSKLIDGTYPDYERVIPSTPAAPPALIDKAPFIRALDRVATVSREKSRAVKLEYQKGRLTVSCTSSEFGAASQHLFLDCGNRQPSEVGFQARYLKDMLKRIGQRFVWSFEDKSSPSVFSDPDRPGVLYVLMPMRV